jgi:hypothetical protein
VSLSTLWTPLEPASLRTASDALATLRATRQVLERDHERDRMELAAIQGRLDVYPKTAEALDAEGWLHSGDIGMWTSEGTLRIIDRKKNILCVCAGCGARPPCSLHGDAMCLLGAFGHSDCCC